MKTLPYGTDQCDKFVTLENDPYIDNGLWLHYASYDTHLKFPGH